MTDYAALAKQFGGTTTPTTTPGSPLGSYTPPGTPPPSPASAAGGGTVDYAALAKKFGGTTVPAGGSPTPTPTTTPSPAPVSNGQKVLNTGENVGNFLGISKLGQGLSTVGSDIPDEQLKQAAEDYGNVSKILALAHKTADPARRQQLLNLAKNYGSGPTAQDINPAFGLSDKEVLGSAANAALDVAGAGSLDGGGVADEALGGAGKLLNKTASVIDKVAAPLSSESAGGRIGNAAIKGAGFGLAQGEAQAANDNKTGDAAANQVGNTTLLSSILGGGLAGAGELFKLLTSPNVSEALYNKAIGIDTKTQLADRSPAASMIEQGKIGSKQGLLTDAQKTIDSTNGQINDIIANQSGATTSSVAHNTGDLVEQMRAKLTQQYGDTLGAAGVQKLLDELPVAKLRDNPTLTTADLNSLRQKIDSDFIGNGKWLSINQDPVKISSYKTAADVLRQTVQGTDDRLPPLYGQLSDAITARNSLDKDLAKPHALASMLDLLTALGTGGTALGTGHNPILAAGTALGTFGAAKAAQSAPVQTAAAVGLDRLGTAAAQNGPVIQAGKAVGRIFGRRAVADVASGPTP